MDEQVKQFMETKPDAEALVEHYLTHQRPYAAEILHGEFKRDDPNVYDCGVVSWDLDQGLEKNPTYGILPVGHFEFPISGFAEEMIVLEGILEAEANGVKKMLGIDQEIEAPIGSTLVLDVADNPVIYLCRYSTE
jgi:hypothetical protein